MCVHIAEKCSTALLDVAFVPIQSEACLSGAFHCFMGVGIVSVVVGLVEELLENISAKRHPKESEPAGGRIERSNEESLSSNYCSVFVQASSLETFFDHESLGD